MTDLPEGFDEKLAGKLFEKESEKLWRESHSQKEELLIHNRTSMGNLPSERYTSILEVYTKLVEKLVKLKFDKDKVVLIKSNIALNSNIHPFLIQRIETLIHQWVNTSKVIIQELLPRSGDVDVKNFLITQLKEYAKNINSNFKRDLDIDLHLSSSVEEHSSFLSYIIWGEIVIIGSITGISIGGIAGIGAGVGTFIGTIASIVAILSYFGIKPNSAKKS